MIRPTITSSVGRFIAGAMGFFGAAAAGPLLTTAGATTGIPLSGPVAAGILSIMAIFASGATWYRGRQSDRSQKQIKDVCDWLEALLKQHLSLAKALAGVSDEEAMQYGVVCERLRVMREVFTGGIEGLVGRLAHYPDFVNFVKASVEELEASDDQFRIALSDLIDSAIEQKTITVQQVVMLNSLDVKLDKVIATQGEHSESLDQITTIVTEVRAILQEADAETEMVATDDPIPDDLQATIDEAKALTDVDNYSASIPLLEQLLPAADQSHHPKARVTVRVRLAQALHEAHEAFAEAATHYRNALAIVPANNLALKHSVVHGLADMLAVNGKLDEARGIADAALAIATSSGDSQDIAASLVSLSMIDRALGLHENAIGRLDEAIQRLQKAQVGILEKGKKSHARTLAICYLNKALLLRDEGDTEGAFALFRKAEEYHLVSGDILDAGKAQLFCGGMHCANADFEKGLECFQKALRCFEECENALWGARALEDIAKLFAQTEQWETALHAILGAVAGAEESKHPGEQVHFLCVAGEVIREWKKSEYRNRFKRVMHKDFKETPLETHAELLPKMMAQIDDVHATIDAVLREDKEVREFLEKAKAIAVRENLPKHLANCLLFEARELVPPDDKEQKAQLRQQALHLLKEELEAAESPKERGHLMGRISGLYRAIGDKVQAVTWLKKAGVLFEKTGDVYGLANYHGTLAEVIREKGDLDGEIAAYRKVLSLIEGRSFYDFAAGTRINLAAALVLRRDFAEAMQLLEEAESLCDRHKFKDFIPAIARNRDRIGEQVAASQAPSWTLPELLDNLGTLLRHDPGKAAMYLGLWYYAWKTQLMALVRSGPGISLMVVTDDVDRFMSFARDASLLADHFVMITTQKPEHEVESGILTIPRDWVWPAGFKFMGVTKESAERLHGDDPPNVRMTGPATMIPAYMVVQVGSEENRTKVLAPPGQLPYAAVELMIQRPLDDLRRLCALWFPIPRFSSDDPFLTDLRISHERKLVPAYFDCFPRSDAVSDIGGIEIRIPSGSSNQKSVSEQWYRNLLKVMGVIRHDAQGMLLELSDKLNEPLETGIDTMELEIRLFEFPELGKRTIHPAILVRE